MAVYTTIDNPELHFQVKTYSGNGSADHAITLDGEEDMQPDLVWQKRRNDTNYHVLYDSVRGATKYVYANTTGAENTNANGLTAFNSNGFTLGNDGDANHSSGTHVAWCWKANGSGSSNTDGTINTTKTSANTTSGFSINTFEGTGAIATVGHGLGAAPTVLIVKKTSQGANWGIGSVHIDNWTDYLVFGTGAKEDDANFWNDTAPTSTVFSIGSSGNINTDDEDHVAYCFTPIQGFSKFGTFEGNANAAGPFVYCGFRPAFVMIKDIDNSGNSWLISDNKRNPFNVADDRLFADLDNAENQPSDSGGIDFVSNGFKVRTNDGSTNASGTRIFMAFAEQPFVNSNGVPCNAR
jgi:hypothetical protein